MTTTVNTSEHTMGGAMTTEAVTSADGTKIAFDRLGSGPAVIMVVGAFNTRETTAPLAAALQDRFTVFNYDRRGRGDSGDTHPYAIERALPTDLASKVSTPTLVIDGENSPPIMHSAARALSDTLPDAQRRTLAGQNHDINPDVTAAVLEEFLSA